MNDSLVWDITDLVWGDVRFPNVVWNSNQITIISAGTRSATITNPISQTEQFDNLSSPAVINTSIEQ